MKISIVSLTAAMLLGLASSASAGALLHEYDFSTGLNDNLGGPSLASLGGSVSGGRYHFGNNQGLQLVGALTDTSSYGIEFNFRMNTDPTHWNKLVDFSNRSSDLGLYVQGSNLGFYNSLLGNNAPITTGQDYNVLLTRNGNTGITHGYLNGSLVFSGPSSGSVPTANFLTFFADDFATGQGETFAGSVDFIRIYEGEVTAGEAATNANTPPGAAVPEPGSSLLLFVSALVLIGRRRS